MCFSPHGVHFFDISTSKSAPNVWCALYTLTWTCASRHNGVQFFISYLAAGSARAALASQLFDPPEPQIIGKNTVDRDFPTFSRTCVFFLLSFSLLWSSHFLFFSSVTLPTSVFPSVHIVGSLTSKLLSIMVFWRCVWHLQRRFLKKVLNSSLLHLLTNGPEVLSSRNWIHSCSQYWPKPPMHIVSNARCFTPPFLKFRKCSGLSFQSRELSNLEMENPWESPAADEFSRFSTIFHTGGWSRRFFSRNWSLNREGHGWRQFEPCEFLRARRPRRLEGMSDQLLMLTIRDHFPPVYWKKNVLNAYSTTGCGEHPTFSDFNVMKLLANRTSIHELPRRAKRREKRDSNVGAIRHKMRRQEDMIIYTWVTGWVGSHTGPMFILLRLLRLMLLLLLLMIPNRHWFVMGPPPVTTSISRDSPVPTRVCPELRPDLHDIQGVPTCSVQAKTLKKDDLYNHKICIIILQTPCFEYVQDIDCGWQLAIRRR